MKKISTAKFKEAMRPCNIESLETPVTIWNSKTGEEYFVISKKSSKNKGYFPKGKTVYFTIPENRNAANELLKEFDALQISDFDRWDNRTKDFDLFIRKP